MLILSSPFLSGRSFGASLGRGQFKRSFLNVPSTMNIRYIFFIFFSYCDLMGATPGGGGRELGRDGVHASSMLPPLFINILLTKG